MKTILYRPYYKKSGKYLKQSDFFVLDGEGCFLSKKEVAEYMVDDGYDLLLDLTRIKGKKHEKYFNENFCFSRYLMSLLVANQEKESKDTKYLNHIIRNGGYTPYIKSLESRLQLPLKFQKKDGKDKLEVRDRVSRKRCFLQMSHGVYTMLSPKVSEMHLKR